MRLNVAKKGSKVDILIPKKVQPSGGQSEGVSTGDVVDVEVIRNGKTIYKGR